jgi:4-amino-4-deoxy-L-arabinose transferase-like glycosyltransferase
VLLHLAIGAAAPAVVDLFTAREFGDRNAALATGIAFALYPVGILTSLEALAEAPFALLLALALLALSRAREPSADWRHAAAAGLALTVAAMLRYEAWMLTPFLGLVLWPRRRLVAAFVAAAALWPVASMAANYVHYGDPFLGLGAGSAYELQAMGKAQLSLARRAGLPLRLVANLVAGMTPVLALLVALGALSCLVRRARQAVWLVPPAGLLVLLLVATARGAVVPKPHYTETIGLLLVPYLAAFLRSPPVRRLPAAGVHAALFGSMALLLVIGTLRDVPGVRERSRLVRAVPALGPAPTFAGRDALDRLLPVVRADTAGEGDGLVSDFLGYGATGYLALRSRLYPDRVWLAPVAPEADLDMLAPGDRRPSRARVQPLLGDDPAALDEFLLRHPSGVLVLQPGSRLSARLGDRAPDRASAGGVDLALAELARVPWPLPPDRRLRAEGVPATAPGEAVVFRYSVARPAADSG